MQKFEQCCDPLCSLRKLFHCSQHKAAGFQLRAPPASSLQPLPLLQLPVEFNGSSPCGRTPSDHLTTSLLIVHRIVRLGCDQACLALPVPPCSADAEPWPWAGGQTHAVGYSSFIWGKLFTLPPKYLFCRHSSAELDEADTLAVLQVSWLVWKPSPACVDMPGVLAFQDLACRLSTQIYSGVYLYPNAPQPFNQVIQQETILLPLYLIAPGVIFKLYQQRFHIFISIIDKSV